MRSWCASIKYIISIHRYNALTAYSLLQIILAPTIRLLFASDLPDTRCSYIVEARNQSFLP